MGVHLHVSGTPEQVRLAQETYGRTPVELLEETGILDRPAILAHCLYPTEADLDRIAARGAGVARAPKTYLRAGMGIGTLAGFQDRKIPVGLASDGAASSSTLDKVRIRNEVNERLARLTQRVPGRKVAIYPA